MNTNKFLQRRERRDCWLWEPYFQCMCVYSMKVTRESKYHLSDTENDKSVNPCIIVNQGIWTWPRLQTWCVCVT